MTEEKAEGKSSTSTAHGTPNLVDMGWEEGQRFTIQDDPDRCGPPVQMPAFITQVRCCQPHTSTNTSTVTSTKHFSTIVVRMLGSKEAKASFND